MFSELLPSLSKRLFASTADLRKMSSVIPGLNTLFIDVLRAGSDNYMYVVRDEAVKDCVLVDPFDSRKVIDFMIKNQLKLVCVLTTHHHHDHAGGNSDIKKAFGVPVYGCDERIECIDRILDHRSILRFGTLRIQCLRTPGHTSGHACYLLDLPSNPKCPPAIFTGDTLFISGCGRLFEGTAGEMYDSLYKVLGSLEPWTRVYCGHEYTLRNLEFARMVDPTNTAVSSKRDWAVQRLEDGLPTVPSTIGEEFTYNPFLRVADKKVQEFCRANGLMGSSGGQSVLSDPVAYFACLRALKDRS
ncbi:hypothetical protein ACOME3_010289 [Neoechinorhynchus agilis]